MGSVQLTPMAYTKTRMETMASQFERTRAPYKNTQNWLLADAGKLPVAILLHCQTIVDFFDSLDALGQLYGSLCLWQAGNNTT